ncbi:hypothetical protein T11_16420 [Trichinella zimbabwensis]|uniref:Uncharacterized protein n=1 Tax=Trichinella zimbabwensis TaxID=268475 RepID=A0A0V1I0V7_9BILA|nr:hypothetical protein T11_16420 [Trichinella zimbabwensis]
MSRIRYTPVRPGFTAEQTMTKSCQQLLLYHFPANYILTFATKASAGLGSLRLSHPGTSKGKLLPVVYCTRKRPAQVSPKEQDFQLDSTTFVCDFETALISAVQGSFCNTRVEYKVAFSTFAKLYFGRSAGLA